MEEKIEKRDAWYGKYTDETKEDNSIFYRRSLFENLGEYGPEIENDFISNEDRNLETHCYNDRVARKMCELYGGSFKKLDSNLIIEWNIEDIRKHLLLMRCGLDLKNLDDEDLCKILIEARQR